MPPVNAYKFGTYYILGSSLCIFILFLLSLIAFVLISNKGSSDFAGIQDGLHDSDSSSSDKKTLITTCTNITLNFNGTKTFEGDTFIKYNCQESDNDCSEWICGDAGVCRQVLTTDSVCWENEQCGVGNSCNINTCTCQLLPNTTTGCIVDTDCPVITDRGGCSEYLCNMFGQCEETLVTGATCWFDSQCDPSDYCNIVSCACETRDIIPCLTSADCPVVTDRGGCAIYDCISNECVEGITGLGECWFDNQCATGFECNTTSCGCVAKQTGCTSDSECINLPDRGNNCSAALCTNGRCEETIILGDCWFDGNCALNEVCSTSNCTCIPAPVFLCLTDSDCTDISDRGDCVTNVCQSGQCIETVIPSGDCWYDGQCATVEERCNPTTCLCEAFIIPPCDLDVQCPDISDRGICVEYVCNGGFCNETILGLGECWFDGQCATGETCDQSTCGCVSVSNTCSTGYNLQALPTQGTGLNLTCGLDIAIFRNYIVELCLYFDPSGNYPYVLISYVRFGSTWLYTNYLISPVTVTSFPTEPSAKIAIWEDLVIFFGRFSSQPQPQPTSIQISRILSNGQINQIQSFTVGSSNATGACVDIWDTTIVVVDDSAFIYDQATPTTWTLTQTITDVNNFSFFDCSMFEDKLVLSMRNTSVGYSWISYINSGSWTQAGSYLNTVWSGEWNVEVIDNNLETTSGFEFTVVASPYTPTISITEVTSDGGTQLSQPSVVTTTGPGILSSFNKTFVIADNLFLNSFTSSISFQNMFPGCVVTANDVWYVDPAFSASPMGDFTQSASYANFCPNSL